MKISRFSQLFLLLMASNCGTIWGGGNSHQAINASTAQQAAKITVQGTIVDTQDMPLIGVSILESGTTNGTITDIDGKFTLSVNAGATLELSYIGYKSQKITAKPNLGTIQMSDDTEVLEEVVVTALGIKREKKALGYAQQELKGDALVSSRESNLANSLSGKVAGLQVVRGSGGPGSSSKIVLRGNSSISGSNQPLIVVDGVPMDNFTSGVEDAWGNDGMDMGNGLSDINPDDIESMSVLKGASAAALYGSRAGNGVILITTKSGKKQEGLGITVTSSITAETMFMTPELQNSYGQGSNNIFNIKSRGSWGPIADGTEYEQWNGTHPLRTYDNLKNYFDTGMSFNEGISFQQSKDGTSVFASVNRTDQTGIVPGAKLEKTSVNLRGTTLFGKDQRWKLDGKITYLNNKGHNRPTQGINQSNAFYTIYNIPRSINILDLKNCLDEKGNMIWWDTEKSPQENPYWSKDYRLNEDTRNRLLAVGSLSYKFTDWWNMEIKAGTDYYSTTSNEKIHSGGNVTPKGRYSENSETFYENNFSFLSTMQKDNLFGKFGGFLTLGGNLMMQKRAVQKTSTGDLLIPNLFSINNAADKLQMQFEYTLTERKMNSLYGSLQLNYGGWAFLDITARNDWSSTMSKPNRSYFYPSFSVSAVITDMLEDFKIAYPSWLTFAKVRASYAEVGNDLDPYKLYNVYELGKDDYGNPVANIKDILYNANVRSELVKSYEFGVDLKLFDNRFGLDFSYYKTNATSQLLELPLDPFTGFTSKMINAGNIQNSGIEVMAYFDIFRNQKGFNWTLSANLAKNKNKIIELADGINETALSKGGFDEVKIVAHTGGNYGDIYGKTFRRNEQGQIVVNDEGLPIINSNLAYLGNQQPTCMLGITNSFSYKNFSLSFLIDARFGGKIYSATTARLFGTGNAAGTVINGKREDFVVPNSVKEDGSVNNTAISPQRYWEHMAQGNLGVGEAFLYDATNVRLRNITLGYDFNKKMLGSHVQRLKLSFTMNNVWMIKSHIPGIDPESIATTNTNATGIELGGAPTPRSYTFNVTVGF